MPTYTIDFTLMNFDEQGEEHRLRVSTQTDYRSDAIAHRQAAQALLKFAARLLGTKIEQSAIRRVQIKSAWVCDQQGKRRRVTPKMLMEAVIGNGTVAARGRGSERLPTKPLGRHVGRR